MPDTPVTAEQYREAQGAEWSQYVAKDAIYIDGGRAFNAGDPVPVSHIENKIVHPDQVEKTTTKAGRAAAGIDQKG